jgi:hypothetical protein
MADKPDSEMGKTFTALVRIHEANVKIEYPSEQEQNFRVAIMKKIAQVLELADLRPLGIAGNSKGIQRPAAAGGGKAGAA